ncbi:MAG: HepT-like ribonuclease domain-containing protein [Caulobacteraceae bacterium]
MRSGRIRLEDISEAITGIEQTLTGVDLEAFSQSWLIQRAVERGLEIVSEASRSIPDELKAKFPSVPWHQIAGIGNILRHEYHRVEPAIIWNITKVHLPVLSSSVKQMLMRPE